MLDIYLYNSLTRQLEQLEPKDPGKVRMYHCGPTVYKRQHIGNLRRYLFADFLRRSIEWLGYEVREIMNITDVGHLTQDDIDGGEDKLEKEARQRKMDPLAMAEEQIALFHKDLTALHIHKAHAYPRATAHIPQMIAQIQQLMDKGHAYVTESGVYYDVLSFDNYGKLSGNTPDKIAAGERVQVRQEKKHPADFALWKTNDKNHLQQWDSPWGWGYPGWHIECSAMAQEYLGEDIDIHTGGEDNRFPHHENEIAQFEGATGSRFVRIWMHNRHLLMGGKKLAKREGGLITLDTLQQRGFSPLDFRWFVFSTHYRSPVDFSWESLEAAKSSLETLRQMVRRLDHPAPGKSEKEVLKRFGGAVADDLNTPQAMAVVMDYATVVNKELAQGTMTMDRRKEIWATLMNIDRVLGIFRFIEEELAAEKIPGAVTTLVTKRERARAESDFQESDRLRQEIEQHGYAVEDTEKGPRVKKKP